MTKLMFALTSEEFLLISFAVSSRVVYYTELCKKYPCDKYWIERLQEFADVLKTIDAQIGKGSN